MLRYSREVGGSGTSGIEQNNSCLTRESFVASAHPERGLPRIAGWSSQVARQAHNLKVVGSNPTPVTNEGP